jgi:tetratricopeptide (TPR) repeat protein
MGYSDTNEILAIAREAFVESKYQKAEPLLNQLLLLDTRNPEIFQMLGTIYYDRGQFKKAIKTFQRALEIDPTYTDASVGLSIILNDLGRYEEGRTVFESAQKELAKSKNQSDPYLNERLAQKHLELAEMYSQYKRFQEGLEQYFKALNLTSRKAECQIKIADTYTKLGENKKALKLLRDSVAEYPGFLQGQIKLGMVLYQSGRVVEAIEEWEKVLLRDPKNEQAKEYIRIAQNASVTELGR